MATYVNDLRLTELATGEGSGTWGVTTNTNLELIGEALGYGTQDCFATDADATTTVADGATDPARAMYFKVTSSATLTATRTLTIAPNTMTRVMLIENATTGSQSIAISQGSGGNVTIANGAVKMVYLDGAGAGAAVVDALADLELGTITVANLTATTADINGGTIDGATLGASSQVTITDADMNGGTIDGVVIGGASAAAGTFTTLQADTSLNVDGTVTADGLTVDGEALLQSSTGSHYLKFYRNDSTINAGNALGEIRFGGSDEGDFAEAASIKASAFSAWTITSSPTQLDFYTTANTTTTPLKRVTIADNGDISFYEDTGTTPKFFWDASGERLGLGTTSPDGQLDVRGGSVATVIARSTSADSSARFLHQNDARAYSTKINTDDKFEIKDETADAVRLAIDTSGNVGIGTSSPLGGLHVQKGATSSYSEVYLNHPSGTTGLGLKLYLSGLNAPSTRGAIIEALKGSGNAHDLLFYTNANSATPSEAMRITSTGNVGIGTTSPSGMLTLDKDVATLYDATDDDAQRSGTTTLAITNENGTQNTFAQIAFDLATSGQSIARIVALNDGTSTSALAFVTEGSNTKREVMRLDGSGNVGIGTDSPDSALTVFGGGVAEFRVGSIGPSSNSAIRVSRNDTSVTTSNPLGYLEFGGNDSTSNVDTAFAYVGAEAEGVHSAGNNPTGLIFGVTASGSGTPAEVMRIDSSGNLLVGTTTASVSNGTTPGIALTSGNQLAIGVSSDVAAYLNRISTDGTIVEFRKDGTAVGSIANDTTALTIGSGSTGVKFGTAAVWATTGGSTNANGTKDLGASTVRWKDLYLSGGVYLGGTAAANLLDDYEEGTFTPELADAVSGGNTASITTLKGRYTKIGDVVHIYIVANQIDTTGMTGANDLVIRNLPFTNKNDTDYPQFNFKSENVAFDTNANLSVQLWTGSSYLKISEYFSAASEDFITVNQVTSTTGIIVIAGFYFAA